MPPFPAVVYYVHPSQPRFAVTRYTLAMIPPRRSPKEALNQVLRAETIGILIFVVVGFIIVLVRYGRYLNWHAR